ncbi:MAG: hypothetical protein NC906_04125, partial [Candidatus Omnitrophica bacterium]|nr:hypothetical protein [Candidatus Omnitrophota bacterium]
FFTGKKITLEHNFKNNILAIGNKLNFRGKSFEDVLLIGINVNFSGSSKKDVYIAGDTVYISGFINGNLKIFARNIEAKNLVVEGNTSFVSPEVLIHDDVKIKSLTKVWSRDAQIGGQYYMLYLKTKNVIFSKNIRIERKLIVQSKDEPAIPLNVLKSCEFTYQPPVFRPAQILLSQKFMKLYSFLSLCFPFILMIVFTPRILQETIEIIEKKPIWTFFSGFVLLLLVPVILVFLMITIIGAPLGLIFLTFYISLLYLCRGFTCIVLGRFILWKLKEGKVKIILGLFLGTGVFVLLTAIPKAGYFFQLLFLIVGFGGFFIGRIRMFIKMKRENLI